MTVYGDGIFHSFFFKNQKRGSSQALLCLYALLLLPYLLLEKKICIVSELMRRTVTDSLLLKVQKTFIFPDM